MSATQPGFRVALVLWAGSLWSLLWVVAVLFRSLSDRHLAGQLAATLFSIETYLTLAVAALAALLPPRRRFKWVYLAASLLATNEWILKWVMRAAQIEGSVAGLGFGAWHGVSALLYLVACIAALLLVWQDDFR
jgi:Domain of unknown function (DUF4149)